MVGDALFASASSWSSLDISADARARLLLRNAVRKATRIRDTHDPCGMPVRVSQASWCMPSRQMAVLRLVRNDATHFTNGRGMCFRLSVSSRIGWDTLLKKLLMSKVRAEVASPRFLATLMLCTNAKSASSADLPFTPPKWDGGIRLYMYFIAMYERRSACIRSRPSRAPQGVGWVSMTLGVSSHLSWVCKGPHILTPGRDMDGGRSWQRS